MGSLHQHLAALNELEAQDRKISEESGGVFKKQELFEGFVRVLHMADDARQHEEKGAGESRALTTSVLERIKYETAFMKENLDAQLQREIANTLAKADLELPDGTVVKEVPVTYLMYLEKYWTRKRAEYDGIPTIDTTKRWIPDGQSDKEGALRTEEPERANRQEKTKVVIEKAPATEKHAAQVEVYDKDVVVGYYEKDYQTGKATPAMKHALLSWIDKLIVNVRKAKAKANETAVPTQKLASPMVDAMLTAMKAAV
jgi:hypothetical protein